jgi:hypothetical protein
MDLAEHLTPEERQAAEMMYEVEVEIAEIESEIDTRRGNPLEVERLLRKLSYLERRKDAIGQRPSRIIVSRPLLLLAA